MGGVDPKQLAVYEEFARNMPGFLPSNDLSQPTGFLAQPMKVCKKKKKPSSLLFVLFVLDNLRLIHVYRLKAGVLNEFHSKRLFGFFDGNNN